MAFVWSNHGGGCCGVSHIAGFYHSTLAEFDALLRQHDETPDHGTPGNRLLEAVLTDRQLVENLHVHQSVRDLGGWGNVLASRGFRITTGFNNSNSRRNCYVFHRVTRPIDLTNLPFTMDAERARNVPPVEAVIAAAAAAVFPAHGVRYLHGTAPDTIPIGTRLVMLDEIRIGVNRVSSLPNGSIATVTGHNEDGTIRVVGDNGYANSFYPHRFAPLAVEEPAPEPVAADARFAIGARVVDTASQRVGVVEGARVHGTYHVRMEDSNRTRIIREHDLAPARPQERVVNPRPAPAEPAARDRGGAVVRTQYRSVFQDNRQGILRETEAACREANPRCRRVVRVETLDNGDERVTDL